MTITYDKAKLESARKMLMARLENGGCGAREALDMVSRLYNSGKIKKIMKLLPAEAVRATRRLLADSDTREDTEMLAEAAAAKIAETRAQGACLQAAQSQFISTFQNHRYVVNQMTHRTVRALKSIELAVHEMRDGGACGRFRVEAAAAHCKAAYEHVDELNYMDQLVQSHLWDVRTPPVDPRIPLIPEHSNPAALNAGQR